MSRRLLPVLVVLAATLLPTLSAPAAGDEAARLQRALDDLAVMESLLGGAMNEPTRRELLIKLGSVRQQIQTVQQDLLRGVPEAGVTVSGPGGALVAVTVTDPTSPPTPDDVGLVALVGVPPADAPFAMGQGPFGILRAAIEAESFGDGRLGVLRGAVRENRFTVDQVIQLLPLFPFSDERVDAAVLLHPAVADPEVWFRVYESFDFDSDKAQVRKRLGL